MKYNLLSIFFLSVFYLNSLEQECFIEKKILGFNHPESIVFDGKQFFVSNLGRELAPLVKDADGFISRLTRVGSIQDTNYFKNVRLDAPKGMTILNEVIYVADIGRIVGLDIKARNSVFEKKLEDVCLLVNDLVAQDENKLLFSCSDKGTIWQLDLSTDSLTLITNKPWPGANGLAWDFLNGDLYVATMGSEVVKGTLFKMDFKSRKNDFLGETEGIWDGIQLARGKLIGSDWQSGQIWLCDFKYNQCKALDCGKIFEGPADFTYLNKKIWLPAMKENTIYVLSVK